MAAVVALAISGAALAQGGPGRMWGERGPGMWDGDMMGWGMRGHGFGPWGRGPEGMLDRVEGRLAFIKAELKITEQQTIAWNDLSTAIRGAAKQHNERMKAVFSGGVKEKTLLERLDAQEQLMTTRIEEIRQIKGALKALYAVLSDEQKREADHIVLPMVGMGGPWS